MVQIDRSLETSGDIEPGTPLRFEPTPRRVRAIFNHVTIADSSRAMLMLLWKRTPIYYFPREDVRMDRLAPSEHHSHAPLVGEASYWSVEVGDRSAQNAALSYPHPSPEFDQVRDFVTFQWNRMDAWFEEDDEVFVHPRDPYHRVDVVNSSRHVRIEVAGETIAETRRPRLLFETRLPTRYYIPKLDVRMDLLEPSDLTTQCPYKGKAQYWSVRIGDRLFRDLVWSYPYPIPECPKIENLMAFFNERVEGLYVDGELMPKPITPWS